MSQSLHAAVSILFDGLGYAMILFIMSVGLSVTMGLMGVINLAHGAFAMLGGYAAMVAMSQFGVPFIPGLAIATFATLALSIPIERVLYVRIYRRSELQQMLLTIGLTMIMMAAASFAFGPAPISLTLPAFLESQVVLASHSFPAYRVFIVAVGIVVFLALWGGLERTVLGAKIRASVDNRAMAEAAGIDTRRLFTLTFALGTALAALGGALAVDVVGMTPRFALEYLVLVLVVISVGGLGTVTGSFLAALMIGIVEIAGRYLFPAGGAFFVYIVAVLVLLYRPAGLYGKA
jgi:branched-chain amino acid transport system permease protein